MFTYLTTKETHRMTINAAGTFINSLFAQFDIAISTFIYNLFYPLNSFFTPFFELFSNTAKAGIPLIILSLIFIIFKKTRRFGTAMLISLAVGALITNCFLKIVIVRPRPYADELSWFHKAWLTVGMNTESDNSFPSGHTTAAFAFCTAIFLCGNRKKSWLIYIYGFIMAISRIYLMVHFPSDVLAGIIVGLIGGTAGTLIASKLPYKWYGSIVFQLPDKSKVDDVEHSSDYSQNKKFKNICVGDFGIYYSKGSRKFFIPYDKIDRAFIRIKEVQGDDFGPYQYYSFIVQSEGKELTDIYFSDENKADQIIKAINEKNPSTLTAV